MLLKTNYMQILLIICIYMTLVFFAFLIDYKIRNRPLDVWLAIYALAIAIVWSFYFYPLNTNL